MKILRILLVIPLLLMFSCKKEDNQSTINQEIEDEWPNFVDTGANMVAYKVDGKIRVVKNISKNNPDAGYLSCFYAI